MSENDSWKLVCVHCKKWSSWVFVCIRIRNVVNFELLVFYKSARMIIVYYFEVYISWILFCYSEKSIQYNLVIQVQRNNEWSFFKFCWILWLSENDSWKLVCVYCKKWYSGVFVCNKVKKYGKFWAAWWRNRENMFFCLVTSTEQRENSESPITGSSFFVLILSYVLICFLFFSW